MARAHGFDIEMTDLWYLGDRHDVADYLDARGWKTDQTTMADLFAEYGQTLAGSADETADYTEMNLGAEQHAIDDIICAVLREDHPIPAVLLDRLREWLAVSPIDDRGLARRAARVRTT